MFELDFRSRTPIYEQLVEQFKTLIINDVLQPDEKLPSVRTLAQQVTTNPNTIQKAYRELEQQGYIYSVKGRGSFVSPDANKVDTKKLEEVKEKITKELSEAMYLGLTRQDIIYLIDEIEKNIARGNSDD